MYSAVSSKPLPQRSQSGMSARPALKFKSIRGKAFRASRQLSENSELFKKLDPSAQFQWKRISSALQPCRSLRGSEAEPTTSSRYSSVRGCGRSLDPGRLRRAAWHSRTNNASPIGLCQSSAFRSDWSPTQLSFPHCVPRQVSASQWLSRSSIPRPPLRVR